MRFNDVFTARSLAYRLSADPSNAMPFVGEAFFPTKKKMGIDLRWIKAHKGLGIELKPSTYDALATIRFPWQLCHTLTAVQSTMFCLRHSRHRRNIMAYLHSFC